MRSLCGCRKCSLAVRGLARGPADVLGAGTHARQLSRPALREMVLAAAAKVGAADYTWLPTPVRGRLDDRPWIDGIALQHPTRSVHELARMLQVACYVVIAFLSGLRDAEIKHLRRGCLRVQRDPDGRPTGGS